MEHGPQTIPEYAAELAEWLDGLADAVARFLWTEDAFRYVAEHIRQDLPGLQRDEDRRRLAAADMEAVEYLDAITCARIGLLSERSEATSLAERRVA